MLSQRDAIRGHFDKNTLRWRRLYEIGDDFLSYSIQVRQEKVLKMLDESLKNNGAKILDTGCGAGLTILRLLQRGHFVCGTDLSYNMIEDAKRIIKENGYEKSCNLLISDVENLPFSTGFFDAIVCMGVLPYLISDEEAIREIYRVLKPKGIAIITVRNKRKISELLDIPVMFKAIKGKIARKLVTSKERGSPQSIESFVHRAYIPWKFNKTLVKHGFQVQEYASVGFGPITFNRKEFFSTGTSIKISSKLEDISTLRHIRLLRLLGQQYVVKVQKC